MGIENISFDGKINLGIIRTSKFKYNFVSLNFLLPRTEYNVAQSCVLSNVLTRGTAKHPTKAEINRMLCTYYSPNVSASSYASNGAYVFCIFAKFLDDKFALSESDGSVFSGTVDFIKELLFEPLEKNGELDSVYTESEKKRRIEKIRAEINNKDFYALKRCNEISYEGTPLAVNSNGTEESVSAVTAKSIYDMLRYILIHCPLEAVFAGNYTAEKEKKLTELLTFISGIRKGKEISAVSPKAELRSFGQPLSVCEKISAKQGRMVLNFSIDGFDGSPSGAVVFNEIFGGSPTSRLFSNVRERMGLCYYCSSGVSTSLWRLIVRSGIDISNREKAIDEINRQLKLLSDPDNISEEELEMAKKSILSILKQTGDGCSRYAEWYIHRKIDGITYDIDEVRRELEGVTVCDVARVASAVRLEVNYFLDGTE